MSPNVSHSILAWLKKHPGIFVYQEEGDGVRLVENFSQKTILLKWGDIERLEEKTNAAQPGQGYLVLLFSNGHQLALSLQGLVFPPDFTHSGPIPLPSPVYCMQDFNNILNRLRHVAAEEERKQEALDLILVLIAILDGAKAVGLNVDAESRTVEGILATLETGQSPSPPH